MALIKATFDTIEKTLEVSIDDVKQKDVTKAEFWSPFFDGGNGYAEITSTKDNEDDKTVLVTRLTADKVESVVDTSERDAEITKLVFGDR